MKCPKCESGNWVKDGVVKGKQRHLCKMCNYRYTVKKRGGEISHRKKRAIVIYYDDNYRSPSYREVARHYKISQVSVMNILKEFNRI